MAREFTFVIGAENLTRGLRPSSKSPRDMKWLVESTGAVGRDGILSAVDELERIDTSTITDPFPFPQIFVFTNMIIVCGYDKIYEWVNSALSLKYTAASVGGLWSAVDFYDYVYLSNGKVSVTRDAGTKTYSTSTLPTATSILNFNGQVVIGSANVGSVPAFSIDVRDGLIEASVSLTGAFS